MVIMAITCDVDNDGKFLSGGRLVHWQGLRSTCMGSMSVTRKPEISSNLDKKPLTFTPHPWLL